MMLYLIKLSIKKIIKLTVSKENKRDIDKSIFYDPTSKARRQKVSWATLLFCEVAKNMGTR